MESSVDKYLHQLYYNPKHRTAFSSATNLWRFIKLQGKDISKQQLNDWLSKQDVYTSHHPIIHRFARRRVVTRGIDDVWDADLMDMSSFAAWNDKKSFLLICIDIFSRYLYVEPLESKSTKDTLDGLKNIIRRSKRQPETFRSDAGKEFTGKLMKNFLADREIYQQVTYNEVKANYAERVIRTLKKKIYTYLKFKRGERYIDILSDLVAGYNANYHSSIKCAPNMVTKENEAEIWGEQYLRANNTSAKRKEFKFKFNLGDMVRISNSRNPFSRGFGQTFSEELFKIKRRHTTVPPTYLLEDLKGEPVKGLFYEPEMIIHRGKEKIYGQVYNVEKYLRYRTRKGKQREVLVKWKGYPNAFNSWIPVKDVVQ